MHTEKRECLQRDPEKHYSVRDELEQVFDTVSDMIIITDADHTIVRANRAMAERHGLTPMELIGRKCFDVFHGTTAPSDGCPFDRLVAFQEPQTTEFNAKDASEVYEVTMVPVISPDGKLTSCVHVARDVTALRIREAQAAAHQKQLEDLNSSLEERIEKAVTELRTRDDLLIQQSRLTAMGELINSIAHHWRQPLNNIGLIVQNLQLAFRANDLSIDEFDSEIAYVMRTLQQISETINDFRTFFNHEKDPYSFSVNDAVARSVTFVTPSFRSKRISIVCNDHADVSVTGYPNEFAQALMNILVNAGDALQEAQTEKMQISVSVSSEDNRSIVTVTDSGGGISDEILPKIFDPYFTTRQGNRAGLGLFMSKTIIERHMNGRLSARNVGGGAEFRIEV